MCNQLNDVQIEKITAYTALFKDGEFLKTSDVPIYKIHRAYKNGLLILEADILNKDTVFIEYVYKERKLVKELNFGLGYIDTLIVNSWNEYGKALTYKNSAVRKSYQDCNQTKMVVLDKNQKPLKSKKMLYKDNLLQQIELRFEEWNLANETILFSNYKLDTRQNWISRIIEKPEETYMELRTLVYE